MSLRACHITRKDANRWISRVHSTNGPIVGDLWRAAAFACGEIVGVVTVGRPNARHLQDGWTAEVTRVATDGYRNAASFLYARARKAARLMGFERVISYTRDWEEASPLRADGWKFLAHKDGSPVLTEGRSWDNPGRRRSTYESTAGNAEDKIKWIAPGTRWRTPKHPPPRVPEWDSAPEPTPAPLFAC